jgi:hypothetical protein
LESGWDSVAFADPDVKDGAMAACGVNAAEADWESICQQNPVATYSFSKPYRKSRPQEILDIKRGLTP